MAFSKLEKALAAAVGRDILKPGTSRAAATANGGSAQLDLSAYIDPIARGRTK